MGSTKPPSSLSRNSRSSQIRSSPRLGTNTMVGGAKRSALEIIDDIIDLKMRPNVHELAFELQTYLRQIGYDADGIEVANTFTPELALGSAKAVAKDIAEAVNAYYGVGHARIDLLSSEVDRLQSLFAKAQTKANEQARRAE